MTRLQRRLLVVFGVVVVALMSSPAAFAARGDAGAHAFRPKRSVLTEKADSQIANLIETASSQGAEVALQSAAASRLRVSAGKVHVIVEASDMASAVASIVAAGAEAGSTSANLLQVTATPAQLKELLGAPGIGYVRVPLPHYEGTVSGEGVATSNALSLQLAGNTGVGVKIAVIDGGFAGVSVARASGDLPNTTAHDIDYCGGGFYSATDHGTAVAEIVHEMAPGAELYLICIWDDVDLALAESYAKANGISIISHSMGWFNSSRGDGSGGPGSPDAIAADAVANGILWVNAAGNYATQHWSGTFVDSGVNLNLGGGDYEDAHLFASGDIGNSFYLANGQYFCATLKWDSWPTTSNDFDLILLDGANVIIGGSFGYQAGSQAPVEGFCWVNNWGAGTYSLAIGRWSAASSPRFDLFAYTGPDLQYQTAAGSVAEPASAPVVFAVGAQCWNGTTIEYFSSRGPTISGQVKPDITGQDSVSGTTYGPSYGCGTGFLGTSAAAPHVAGAAALVKAANPGYTVAQIEAFLQDNAIDEGTPGNDSIYGFGLLFLPNRPQAPTGVSGIGYNGSVQVSWSAPTGTVAGYTVTSDPGGFTCTTTGELTCLVTGLTNGTPYTFTVTATNEGGTSDPSDPSAAVTPSTVPDAPVVTAIGKDGAIDVSWTVPDDNGSPITSYRVDVSPGGNFCEVAGTMCGFSSLTNGVTYTVTVFARNANGDGMPAVTSATPRLGSSYVGLTPTRILDTAAGIPSPHGPITALHALTFQVTDRYPGDPTRNVPAEATSVTGVLSVSNATIGGYLALTPDPIDIPYTSTMNFPARDNRSTGVTVTLGPGGTLSVTFAPTAGSTANVAFDVTGYFIEGTSGSTFFSLPPRRVFDSRKGLGQPGGVATKMANGVHQTFWVTGGTTGVPAEAVAVTANVTVTRQSSAGKMTVGPTTDDSPVTATVYSPAYTTYNKDNRATGITIKLGPGGTLNGVWQGSAGSTADLVVDINGYFVEGTSGAMYVPVIPNRVMDTRKGWPTGMSKLVGLKGRTFPVVNQGFDPADPTRTVLDPTRNVPPEAIAVTGTLTVTRQQLEGYMALMTVKTDIPSTSTLNFLRDNRATGVTVPLGPGGILAITYAPTRYKTTHAIFDVSGYFVN
jgi:hypothetical protein